VKSLFLNQELRTLVNNVNNNNFTETKQKIVEAIRTSGRFEDLRHLTEFEKINSPRKLQHAFYNYILAAENSKIIK
jgi:hypothetical protein